MAKSADAFRTISEVAEWLDTPAHVLRFWESRFSQVKPVKRAGGRRYYRPNDMLLLGGIKKLLHEDGMTIKGAQKLLRADGIKKISALSQPLDKDDQDAIDLAPIDAVVELEKEPAPPLTIVASEEPETMPNPEPETAPAPEPEIAPAPELEVVFDPEPEVAPDPEPEVVFEPEPEVALEPEPEVVFEPAPEVAPNPEPEVVFDPVAEVAPEPEPAPPIATELEPVQPEVAIAPSIESAEAVEASQADIAAPSSVGDAPETNDVSAQLSSIYNRLTALHDRMKASIDPSRQG